MPEIEVTATSRAVVPADLSQERMRVRYEEFVNGKWVERATAEVLSVADRRLMPDDRPGTYEQWCQQFVDERSTWPNVRALRIERKYTSDWVTVHDVRQEPTTCVPGKEAYVVLVAEWPSSEDRTLEGPQIAVAAVVFAENRDKAAEWAMDLDAVDGADQWWLTKPGEEVVVP